CLTSVTRRHRYSQHTTDAIRVAIRKSSDPCDRVHRQPDADQSSCSEQGPCPRSENHQRHSNSDDSQSRCHYRPLTVSVSKNTAWYLTDGVGDPDERYYPPSSSESKITALAHRR